MQPNLSSNITTTLPIGSILADLAVISAEILRHSPENARSAFEDQVEVLVNEVYREATTKSERSDAEKTALKKEELSEAARTKKLLEIVISQISLSETADLEVRVAKILKNRVAEITHAVDQLTAQHSPDLKQGWRRLVNSTERLWRELELQAPENPESFESSLNWFSSQGTQLDLDLVFKISGTLSARQSGNEEHIHASILAIINRNCKELLKFYSLSNSELLTMLTNTLSAYQASDFEKWKDHFDASTPTKVLEMLVDMQTILETYVEETEITRWLTTPNKLFSNQSPRTAILSGDLFSVYQFLIGLAQGVHI